MIENKVLGKLLPSHESIQIILNKVRDKYQIPEISPSDERMEVFATTVKDWSQGRHISQRIQQLIWQLKCALTF